MSGFGSKVPVDELLRLLPSQFSERAMSIPLNGKLTQFSLSGREYLRPIYDCDYENVLLCFGRQSEKSTTIGNSCLARSCLSEYHRILFVSPTQTQTETFSRDRLSAPIEQSPTLQFFKGKGQNCPDNVLYKKFATGSDITLRYAYLSADRSRGTSAPMLVLDELQDILVDVIPIVREACSHFEKKTFRFAGTPKTVENTMNVYWENYSTQNEWVIPCDGCGKWNVPDEVNIGKYSLICSKCGKQIYPNHPRAQWASMRDPDWLRNPPLNGVFHGFRIPQIIVSWTKWGEIIDKMEGRGYSRSQFLNECLARAYDTASRLLTRTMLLANCDSSYRVADHERMTHISRLYMGIDWTGGEDGPDKSATVVTIGGYAGGRFKVIYMKRYTGLEAEEDALIFDIMRLIELFGIAFVGCDYGGGHIFNKRLIDRYSLRRIYRYQYCGSKMITYDKELARFLVNRTEALMAVVTALRSGTVFSLPSWEDFKYMAPDFLNVFQEQDARGNVTISKTPGTQDDALHSLTYCFLASMIEHPRPDIMTPTGIDTSSSAASRTDADSEMDSFRQEYREYEY